MRANLLFLIGLVTISSVLSTTVFQRSYANNNQFKMEVDQLKQKNIGSIIMQLAELHQEGGRFAALFDAIDDLKKFLATQLLDENRAYSQVTAQWTLDVERLNGVINQTQQLYDTDVSTLDTKLYPKRLSLQATVSKLKDELQQLNKDKVSLETSRAKQIAVYKAALANYEEGIEAIKKALPFLHQLQNDQSFLEVNAEQFQAITIRLQKSLGKLQFGNLYSAFVETLVSSLQNKNFVNQEGLNKVVGLLNNLLERLQKGLVALNNDEELNKSSFENQHATLVKAIEQTSVTLKTNEDELAETEGKIEATEKHRDEQKKLHDQAVVDLDDVQKAYTARTQAHNELLSQIAEEQATISKAVEVLEKGGVTRNA